MYRVRKLLFTEDWSEIIRIDPIAGPYATLAEALRMRDILQEDMTQFTRTKKDYDVEELE